MFIFNISISKLLSSIFNLLSSIFNSIRDYDYHRPTERGKNNLGRMCHTCCKMGYSVALCGCLCGMTH